VSSASKIFLPTTLHLIGLLALLAIAAFRAAPATRLHRLRGVLVALFALAWLLAAPGAANLLLRALEGPPVEPQVAADTHSDVIVLSSGQLWAEDGSRLVRLDEHGWERLYGGLRLRERLQGRLVLTGGPDGRSGDSMAATMARVAKDFAVPSEAIVTSPVAVNTYEELKEAQRLVAPGARVWLVTSAVHMPRALAVCRSLGLAVMPYPVDFRQIRNPGWRAWLPSNGGPELFALALHEVIGSVVYRLRGWAR
jgi:uncharacterized SAM-binding protein YcdF (DUF218 family)